jgi:hypothetical protein
MEDKTKILYVILALILSIIGWFILLNYYAWEVFIPVALILCSNKIFRKNI